MTTNQEKILNYLLFFLLSLTGLVSLLLVKNNYLYVFVFVFLVLYWQKESVRQILAKYLKSSPSFFSFLTLGMIGVLLFQVFSRSPRFYQRPILTLLVSLVFYLPYFFLWYKIFAKRQNAALRVFFLAGLSGVIIFGLLSGKLTTTVLTAPNLGSGLLYVLLKAAGIFSVVGALTTFPFLFFSDEKLVPPVPPKRVAKRNDSGFTLVEILLGVSLFAMALSLVAVARYRQNIAEQKLEQIEKDRLEKIAEPKPKATEGAEQSPVETPKADKDQVEKVEKGGEQPRPQAGEEPQASEEKKGRSVPSSQESEDFFPYEVADPASCQINPSIPGCEAYYYDPYQDHNSPEYQQQLMEEWYYSQPSPEELFFNDPTQLWSQDPFMYQMFEDIYNFQPIPGLPF